MSSPSAFVFDRAIAARTAVTAWMQQRRPPPAAPEAPLELEVLSLDQLRAHARALAGRHRVDPGRGRDPLLPRLAENERVLRDAYESLGAAVRSHERISPAGEWLLDNFHLIQEQVRIARRHLPRGYSMELPHLLTGPNAGNPRVYAIAQEVIAHVDGRVDVENLTSFVQAYQEVTELTLGEFWAIPIMLRLALLENLRRVAARVVVALHDRAEANTWADDLLAAAESDPKGVLLRAADLAGRNPDLSNAFVAELVRRLHGQGPALEIPLAWVDQRLAERGVTSAVAVQIEGQQQAVNQVSVSASIGSLRFLAATDWRDFVEGSNAVERVLRSDPADSYATMDFATRDRYRHVVEHLARRAGSPQTAVAEAAVRLAFLGRGHVDLRRTHAGFFLVDDGLVELEAAIGARRRWFGVALSPEARLGWYAGAIVAGTAAVDAAVVQAVGEGWRGLIGALALAPASQVAVSIVNWAATVLFTSPRVLPRLDFSARIPDEHRTLVAVPCMLGEPEHLDRLLEGLEIRYLANRDENLFFALVTDLRDSGEQCTASDLGAIALARRGVESLNAKYAAHRPGIFFLFHRGREWNPHEGVWMGYERKRAKLEALNAQLRGLPSPSQPGQPPFEVIVGDLTRLEGARYVITLDADTQLPRDAAYKLIATMAHPLNRAVYDPAIGRVTVGYGILQPRVSVSLPGSRRSFFAALYAGDSGTDPYTRAVSDVYQDLFAEGSFVGKGIYDIDAFGAALAGKLPENRILSHDLLEGSYARCALVSDVQLYEEHPHNYRDDAGRRHRWMRGDWQIAAWLLPRVPGPGPKRVRNPISALSRWKILDNLRRSLVPVSAAILVVFGWFLLANPRGLGHAVGVMILLPPIMTSLAGAMRKPQEVSLFMHARATVAALYRHVVQAALAIVFLPSEAVLAGDAITRACTRMLVTGTGLLDWRSIRDGRGDHVDGLVRFFAGMAGAPLLAVATFAALWVERPDALAPAMPFLGAWLMAPAVAFWLSEVRVVKPARLSAAATHTLRRIARKEWRFFEDFVGDADHWLPPDNVQEYPDTGVAHRTSPTNIGLSLLANLAAHDLGYLSASALLDRTTLSFASMERLERFRGHFYNWYDTSTLAPLPPLYVSTVDTGNLAGLVLTLRVGLADLAEQPILTSDLAAGLADTLASLRDAAGEIARPEDAETRQALHRCEALLAARIPDLPTAAALSVRLSDALATLSTRPAFVADGEPRRWLHALQVQRIDTLDKTIAQFAPWTSLGPPPTGLGTDEAPGRWTSEIRGLVHDLSSLPSLSGILRVTERLLPLVDAALASPPPSAARWLAALRAALVIGRRNAAEALLKIDALCSQCERFADFEAEFIYDKARHLLAIGYNVTEHRRDTGFYDLLASEARVCSFVAIAHGKLPQEHWFSLGRLMTASGGDPTLLSWSGSMFEYLMPLLIMPTFDNTLLDETYRSCVRRQISYGRHRGVPWGVSECAYNASDEHLNYQYQAFGVPGLGFKRGLVDDLVIAPYATLLALMVDPVRAAANVAKMVESGFEGRYGLYEAVDYTPSRLGANQSLAVVRSYMAHHQGMSLLALCYHLQDRRMPRRFQRDPQFQAVELLLHERVPKVTIYHPHLVDAPEPIRGRGGMDAALRVIPTADTPRPEVHLLSNGRYTVMVTNSGGGFSQWSGLAVTRWREDPTRDPWGSFCYIREMATGVYWSAAHQPVLAAGDHYEAIFPLARAEFRRCDRHLDVHTEIAVSPEDDIELRRFTLTNLSAVRRVIELTTYAEVVLAPQAADDAHPAFSNLFIQTEILRDRQAILCTRRPRSADEPTPVMVHLMTVHAGATGEASFETDRERFIGRGRSVAAPLALDIPDLSGTEGSVLDPIVAIRARVEIGPESAVRVHVVTGVGVDRAAALALVEKYRDRHLAERVFELAWTHRQVVLRQLDITDADAQLYGRLASSVLYANPARRPSRSILERSRLGQSGLWGQGISGDLPIILLRATDADNQLLVRQLIQAHGYWRMMGVAVDLVIWNEDDSGYRQHQHDRIMALVQAGAGIGPTGAPGSVFVRRADQMTEEDRVLLQTVARAVLTDTGGSLSEQLERRGHLSIQMRALVPTRAPAPPTLVHAEPEPLRASNPLGGFSEDGATYVITTSPTARTPAPWVNVIANPYFGTVVSESGSAYTWCENAHELRLTPWSNDALTDDCGEAFYVRDEESGEFWSPTPLPVRADAPYVTRHGFGYSSFELNKAGIHSELITYVAIDAPVKFVVLKLRNDSGRPRRLSATGYVQWVLGELRARSLMHVVSEVDPATQALFARNPYHPEFGARIAFFDVNTPRSSTADRTEFIGRNRRLGDPAAMGRTRLSGRTGAALDACAALQAPVDLAEDESRELVFLVGVGRDVEDVRTLLRRFRGVTAARAALAEVQEHWTRTLGAVQVTTPEPHVDLLVNGWLLYQVIACRLWARTGHYQSGGAYGFRDQLQDAMALVHTDPKALRTHLLRCAARQFREGDVQHWWHPPSGRGVRTRFSDDLLWLPLAASRYVLATGDTGVLDVRVPFLHGRPVPPDAEGYADLPSRSDETATLYEHCVRAIHHGLTEGPHGLPLIGSGDWNDGLNLVGQHGRGESVWLAFFLHEVLQEFARVAAIKEDHAFAITCADHQLRLETAIHTSGWDGAWYRRAFFDDGTPLGSVENVECSIDAIAQSWSVLSGVADPESAAQAMEAVSERLVDRERGIVKLLDPPFNAGGLNPGYIQGYVPGVRENGGQYTHAAIWAAMAFAALGDTARAWEVTRMINPLTHTRTGADVARYRVEPYVMAADVYAAPGHVGRGGWTWYTGAAGWMYRLLLESLLGLRVEVDRLYLTPQVPTEWRRYALSYRYRETTYRIQVHLGGGREIRWILDGAPVLGDALVLVDDRAAHEVTVAFDRPDPADVPSK